MVPACSVRKEGRNNYGIRHLLIQEWIFLSNMLMSGLYTALHGCVRTHIPELQQRFGFSKSALCRQTLAEGERRVCLRTCSLFTDILFPSLHTSPATFLSMQHHMKAAPEAQWFRLLKNVPAFSYMYGETPRFAPTRLSLLPSVFKWSLACIHLRTHERVVLHLRCVQVCCRCGRMRSQWRKNGTKRKWGIFFFLLL